MLRISRFSICDICNSSLCKHSDIGTRSNCIGAKVNNMPVMYVKDPHFYSGYWKAEALFRSMEAVIRHIRIVDATK